MARLAYILLCHKDPEAIVQQARMLTGAGDFVAIHFDARAPKDAFARLHAGLADTPGVVFARRRIRCGWGEWSLVQATLNTLETALAQFPDATHFYMLSGDCAPIKSAAYAHAMLDARDVDYIESFDYFTSDWIKTGMKEERLIYRHVVNERAHKRWFYASLEVQKRLRLARATPPGVAVQIGSQWWCLRRRTVERILDFLRQRRDVTRFFRTTWIPDETFFQTLVRHLVPATEIDPRTLTFLMFTDYGLPVTFYNDQYDMLLGQDCLFARKISPEAVTLKRRLGALYGDDSARFEISNEGRALFRFLSQRGREGRRFAPRFWEVEGSIGRDRELLIIVCKKWHVAKRLGADIRRITDVPVIDYLFNEDAAGLPDLGWIETTLAKRSRHRRALLRMLFDYYGTERLIICIDPGNMDVLRDLCSDKSKTRVLEIQCAFCDSYLVGHAIRLGLAGAQTPQATLDALLPTIRNDIRHETERLRDAGLEHHLILRERDAAAVNAACLARFLDIPVEMTQDLVRPDHLFAD